MIIIGILFFIFFILFILLLTKIKIRVYYNEHFYLNITVLGITKKIPLKRNIEQGIRKEIDFIVKDQKHDFRHVIKQVKFGKGLLPIINALIEEISIDKFILKINVGLKDAAQLGQLIGLIWIIYGNILLILNKFKKQENIDLNVIPIFNNEVFKLDFDCIISFRIVHIIIVLFKFYKQLPILVKKAF